MKVSKSEIMKKMREMSASKSETMKEMRASKVGTMKERREMRASIGKILLTEKIEMKASSSAINGILLHHVHHMLL